MKGAVDSLAFIDFPEGYYNTDTRTHRAHSGPLGEAVKSKAAVCGAEQIAAKRNETNGKRTQQTGIPTALYFLFFPLKVGNILGSTLFPTAHSSFLTLRHTLVVKKLGKKLGIMPQHAACNPTEGSISG